MYNILLCCAGRRVRLVQQLKKSLDGTGNVFVADFDKTAPTMFFADKGFKVPAINEQDYVGSILDICKKESVKAVTTLIDTDIAKLAKFRKYFEDIGVLLLGPSKETADLCLDKFAMHEHLAENNIKAVFTYSDLNDFMKDYENGSIDFPLIVKPRLGSGGVDVKMVHVMEELQLFMNLPTHHPKAKEKLVIQKYMEGEDISADVYVDCVSGEVISVFAKKKLRNAIGGAIKVVSYRDYRLFDFMKKVNRAFKFRGPIDVDLFYEQGEYYINEINPRFGGGYIYADAMNIDFLPFILKNIDKKENISEDKSYKENVLMAMYDELYIGG